MFNMNEFETLSEALKAAEDAGFRNSFMMEGRKLRCIETGDVFEPRNVRIVNYHRFEGASSEDDMSIVYVIECSGGIRGTIVDAYGTYSDGALSEFLREVRLDIAD